MTKKLILPALLALALSPLAAQLSITATGVPVVADISDYEGAGFQPGGGLGTLNSDIWAAEGFSTGDVDFGGTVLAGDLARGIGALGSITTGGIYALLAPSPVKIWIQPTADDFTPGSITLRLQNNTAVNIGQLFINYTAWASNDEDRSNNLICSWSTDNITYTDIAGSEFISPDSADLSLYEQPFELIATGFDVAPGDFFYVRWTGNDVGGGGSRDEFGLNNFSFVGYEAAVIPEYNFEFAELEVNEATPSATIEFSISESADCTFSLAYDPSSTATPGSDYGISPFTLTFTAGGPTTATINVAFVDDLITEPTETGIIIVNDITGGCVAGATSSTTIFIADNDSIVPPIATFTTAGVTEDEGVGSVFGTVELDAPGDCVFQLYLDLATTMENGLDYSFFLPDYITFTAAGPTTQTFEVPIIDDTEIESTEMLLINMIPWTGGCVVAGIADYEINITDNDVASIPTVAFVVDSDTKEENAGSVNTNIIVSESADCTVSITATGTAVNGLDYSVTLPATINFVEGGATVESLVANIIDDTEIESDETIIFTLEVTGGTCVAGAITTHAITITDNDFSGINGTSAPAISITPNPVTEFITISSVSNIHRIHIMDISGALLRTLEPAARIDVRELPAGNYILLAETTQGIAATPFIKQ